MGLISLIKKWHLESVQCDVDEYCEEYLLKEEAVKPYREWKKELAHQCCPRKGDDLLAKKAAYIDGYSIREEAFQREYMSLNNNEFSRLKSKISRDRVQEARLLGQIKWRSLASRIR